MCVRRVWARPFNNCCIKGHAQSSSFVNAHAIRLGPANELGNSLRVWHIACDVPQMCDTTTDRILFWSMTHRHGNRTAVHHQYIPRNSRCEQCVTRLARMSIINNIKCYIYKCVCVSRVCTYWALLFVHCTSKMYNIHFTENTSHTQVQNPGLGCSHLGKYLITCFVCRKHVMLFTTGSVFF